MRIAVVAVLAICVAIGMVGCANVSKPYVMQMERHDQVVDGNRGYLKGTPPPAEDLTGRKRPFLAIDVDLPPASGEGNVSTSTERTVVKARKEVTTVKGTPVSIKETITVTEENIK